MRHHPVLATSLLLLAGCAGGPSSDPAYRAEKSPMAAALAGEADPAGRIAGANARNAERARAGDWRAAKPAVGPSE